MRYIYIFIYITIYFDLINLVLHHHLIIFHSSTRNFPFSSYTEFPTRPKMAHLGIVSFGKRWVSSNTFPATAFFWVKYSMPTPTTTKRTEPIVTEKNAVLYPADSSSSPQYSWLRIGAMALGKITKKDEWMHSNFSGIPMKKDQQTPQIAKPGWSDEINPFLFLVSGIVSLTFGRIHRHTRQTDPHEIIIAVVVAVERNIKTSRLDDQEEIKPCWVLRTNLYMRRTPERQKQSTQWPSAVYWTCSVETEILAHIRCRIIHEDPNSNHYSRYLAKYRYIEVCSCHWERRKNHDRVDDVTKDWNPTAFHHYHKRSGIMPFVVLRW